MGFLWLQWVGPTPWLQWAGGHSLAAVGGAHSLAAVGGLLLAAASLVAEHRLYGVRVSVAVVPGL